MKIKGKNVSKLDYFVISIRFVYAADHKLLFLQMDIAYHMM